MTVTGWEVWPQCHCWPLCRAWLVHESPSQPSFLHSLPFQASPNTVDGSAIRRSPVELGSLSHYLQGFIYPNWLTGFLNHQQYHKGFDSIAHVASFDDHVLPRFSPGVVPKNLPGLAWNLRAGPWFSGECMEHLGLLEFGYTPEISRIYPWKMDGTRQDETGIPFGASFADFLWCKQFSFWDVSFWDGNSYCEEVEQVFFFLSRGANSAGKFISMMFHYWSLFLRFYQQRYQKKTSTSLSWFFEFWVLFWKKELQILLGKHL